MPIQSFDISNTRGIMRAACDQVPPLMIIAGPNGSGKSTLLHALREQRRAGTILYLGPHRTSRRQQVQARYLYQQPISLQQVLASSSVPGYDGISISANERDPWGFDESVNYLKHGLCQIEMHRRDAVASRFDRDGQIPQGTLPDIWGPLRELTHNLLPHLSFHGIETSEAFQLRCLWDVHARGAVVDLDDLSSGEKSIIQMFYPLIEHRIKSLLQYVRTGTNDERQNLVSVLIDEPELHLHPNLQGKVLDYLRILTFEGDTQVIVATHSPNIVEHATAEELYLLRPVEMIEAGENQLIQVADNEDRLRFLREVFGTTANLTAFQPIVIVEGISDGQQAKTISDRRLYRALHPKFDQVTIVPGGGKTEALRLRDALHEALGAFTSKLLVVTLLDRDLADQEPAQPEHRLLPVSMIENFFLDPEIIWEAIQSVIDKTGFGSPADVAAALDAILDEKEQEEIERRVVSSLRHLVFRPSLPVDMIPDQVKQFVETIQDQFSAQQITQAMQTASENVEEIRKLNKRREYYHGKQVLDRFYAKHLHSTPLSKQVFRFELARHARARRFVAGFFDEFFVGLLPQDDTGT